MSDQELTAAQKYLQEVAPAGGALNAEQSAEYKRLLALEGTKVSHEDELREVQAALAFLGFSPRNGP